MAEPDEPIYELSEHDLDGNYSSDTSTLVSAGESTVSRVDCNESSNRNPGIDTGNQSGFSFDNHEDDSSQTLSLATADESSLSSEEREDYGEVPDHTDNIAGQPDLPSSITEPDNRGVAVLDLAPFAVGSERSSGRHVDYTDNTLAVALAGDTTISFRDYDENPNHTVDVEMAAGPSLFSGGYDGTSNDFLTMTLPRLQAELDRTNASIGTTHAEQTLPLQDYQSDTLTVAPPENSNLSFAAGYDSNLGATLNMGTPDPSSFPFGQYNSVFSHTFPTMATLDVPASMYPVNNHSMDTLVGGLSFTGYLDHSAAAPSMSMPRVAFQGYEVDNTTMATPHISILDYEVNNPTLAIVEGASSSTDFLGYSAAAHAETVTGDMPGLPFRSHEVDNAAMAITGNLPSSFVTGNLPSSSAVDDINVFALSAPGEASSPSTWHFDNNWTMPVIGSPPLSVAGRYFNNSPATATPINPLLSPVGHNDKAHAMSTLGELSSPSTGHNANNSTMPTIGSPSLSITGINESAALATPGDPPLSMTGSDLFAVLVVDVPGEKNSSLQESDSDNCTMALPEESTHSSEERKDNPDTTSLEDTNLEDAYTYTKLWKPTFLSSDSEPNDVECMTEIITNEMRQMMFVSGETIEPSPETTTLVELIVQQQVQEMLREANNLALRRGNRSISTDDLMFLIRHDKAKLSRLRHFLAWKDVRKNVKDSDGDQGGGAGGDIGGEADLGGAGVVGGSGPAADLKKGNKKARVDLLWDVQSFYSEQVPPRDDEDDEEEEEMNQATLQRLKYADERTRNMSREDYMHWSECRQASFTFRKAKRFREWAGFGQITDSKPNDDIIDILGFLTFEIVQTLTEEALKVKAAEDLWKKRGSGAAKAAAEETEGAKKRKREPGLFDMPEEERDPVQPSHVREAFRRLQEPHKKYRALARASRRITRKPLKLI